MKYEHSLIQISMENGSAIFSTNLAVEGGFIVLSGKIAIPSIQENKIKGEKKQVAFTVVSSTFYLIPLAKILAVLVKDFATMPEESKGMYYALSGVALQ